MDNNQTDQLLFTPVKIGPITLRNRTIRSAAFEDMCFDNRPSQQLRDYHMSVAEGGIGMTTIAYAAVTRSGLSFDKQLWLRPEIVGELRALTDEIHSTGAKASIQLGHCGNMSHPSTAGQIPISACTGFNLYSPTIVRGMRDDEIRQMAVEFGNAVRLAKDAGFDCVEIHAGHGYLISQFLSPYTNHRRDRWGGDLNHRMDFMRLCIDEVMRAAGGEIAVVVKTNMRDGFRGGNDLPEGIIIAQELEKLGVDGLVLSGGFVSKAPMYVMRGSMPIHTMTHYMDCWWLKYGVRFGGGQLMIKNEPYKDLYFLDDALEVRRNVKLPLIYVGGCVSRTGIEKVLHSGFEAVQMARALINEPDFVNRMANGEERCGCDHVNYCIARMYSIDMKCHKHCTDLPKSIVKEIENIKRKNAQQ
ncbi:MAG: NADH:flavin oxidoreductase [Bacteroidales bacterium]|nr:NADH:flavin oxidoreductase [Bacteroidales bacterium]